METRDDDTPTRGLRRRDALAALGTVTLGTVLAACGGDDEPARVTTSQGETATVQPRSRTGRATPELLDEAGSCRLTPELTEGPFYFDVDAICSDITEDREGTPLRLALRVRDAASCEPIENALVDIWHCDATGLYSGFESASPGGQGGGGGPSDEETYLRGVQATNEDGIARFTTIHPGWYRGRTVHIHVKVHLDRATLLTSQLFFDDAFSDSVYTAAPYSGVAGRDTFNDGDGIFGEAGLLTLRREGDGVVGLLNLDVQRA